MMRIVGRLAAASVAVWVASCTPRTTDITAADRVELRLASRNAERVARFYLGGMVSPAGGDPVEAGLLTVDGSRMWLHPAELPPAARAEMRDEDGDGVLDGDEFGGWGARTYSAARSLPTHLDSLAAGRPWTADSGWFSFDVVGSPMTTARRRLYIDRRALRSAIRAHLANGSLRYPDGTLVIGEHFSGDSLLETTVKRRRSDGFWDFMVFDGEGRSSSFTSSPPRRLRAPRQCTGCHLGARLFEPDRSFPARAPRGPSGERAIAVPDSWRDSRAAAIFREHASRADGLLGLYATLYVGRLRAERSAGRPLPQSDATILEALDERDNG